MASPRGPTLILEGGRTRGHPGIHLQRMADYLLDYQPPELREPVFLCAFSGWADAGEAASHALRYVVEHLGARRFASIDPEEFYDFTQQRPRTSFDRDGNRHINWPANEFFAWTNKDGYPDLVVLIGIEPSLRWRAFTTQIVDLVKEVGVSRVIQVGALLDAVPHTREPRITGTALAPELRPLLEGLELRRPRYTGPTGITGVLGDALRRRDVPFVSVWGHAPHYLHVSPNPKVSLSLVGAVEHLLHLGVDVEQLRSEGSTFDRRVAQALASEPEVREYVEKLEIQYDNRVAAKSAESIDMPAPEDAVHDMEEFLRSLRRPSKGES